MLVKRLTYTALLIFIPDYAFSQTASKIKVQEEHIPCEYGWYNFKEKCFKISGPAERLGWQKAADHCATLEANLATVESKEENDFLVSLLLLEIQSTAWIGLHDQVNESDYHWQSGSRSQYRNWRESEPSGLALEHEDCVQLLVDLYHDSVGEWNDNGCDNSIGFICEKKTKDYLSTPNLRNCSAADGGGLRFQSSCYHLVTDAKSWEEAEQHCMDNYGGHLITVLDKTVDFFLKFLYQGMEPELWIGIKFQDQLQQKWTSDWYVGYNGFSEEYHAFVEGTCALRRHRKVWEIVPCSRKYSFICEKSKVKPPVRKLPPKDSSCPSLPKGWRDMGGEFCYYIETSKTVTWHEANFECMRRDSNLLILNSKEESEILRPFIQYSHIATFLGLMRHYKQKNAFKWTDGSEISFANWAPGEPNNGNELCVEARAGDMKWNDIDCTQKRPYICSVRKITQNSTTQSPAVSSVIPSSTTAERSADHLEGSSILNSTKAGLSDEQVKVSGHVIRDIIIGVVVCSIVLVIILGIVLYKFRLCSKKTLSTQFLNYKDMNKTNEQDC